MTLTSYDAWLLRRLLLGHTVNGELEPCSQELLPLAQQLAQASPEKRNELFRSSHLDPAVRIKLLHSLIGVDPDGPPPAIQPHRDELPPDPGRMDHTKGDPRPVGPAMSTKPTPWARIPTGTVLICRDRDEQPPNFGKVLSDLDSQCEMIFREGEGLAETRVNIDKSLMTYPDGRPLTEDALAMDANGWPSLATVEIPPVLRFPIEVLPEVPARLVNEGAESIGCPPDFLGMAVLATAAGVIGRSVSLRLKSGYFAGPPLFAASIGPPSDGKSPAMKIVAGGIRRIAEDLAYEYSSELDRWRQEVDRLKLQDVKPKPTPPPRPKSRRVELDDVTIEALVGILAENPRGLVWLNDELSALVFGLNQYKGGKGNDRSILLKIWAGGFITKDRVSNLDGHPICCPHPTLTIYGGMTPDMLPSLKDAQGRSDGFVDRFLFAYPDVLPVPHWQEQGVSDDIEDEWYDLLKRLWDRSLVQSGTKTVPQVANFSPGGKARWAERYGAHADEMNGADFPPTLKGAWGKLREYAGRFALILTCLRWASDPVGEPTAALLVDERMVEDAWDLVEYFKSHARRVHAVIAGATGLGGGPVVKTVVDWIRAGQLESFSEHEIKQARRTITGANLTSALEYLVGKDFIRRRPQEPPGPKGGRPPSPSYEVNPSLHEARNPQNAQNPQPDDGDAHGSESFEGFENE